MTVSSKAESFTYSMFNYGRWSSLEIFEASSDLLVDSFLLFLRNQ